jgi:hypothetical protein
MPNIGLDFDVCDGKTFRELCKDVIDRSQSKKNLLDTLITDIRSMIKGTNEAQVFLPRIKEFLEVGVKNDEQIIKLAAVVQRLQSTQLEASGGDSAGLSEEEKTQLMEVRLKEIEAMKEIQKEVHSSITSSTQL